MNKDGSAADAAAHMGCRSIIGSSGPVAALTGWRTWNRYAGIATGGSMQEESVMIESAAKERDL
jgi:hypothetical protein